MMRNVRCPTRISSEIADTLAEPVLKEADGRPSVSPSIEQIALRSSSHHEVDFKKPSRARMSITAPANATPPVSMAPGMLASLANASSAALAPTITAVIKVRATQIDRSDPPFGGLLGSGTTSAMIISSPCTRTFR
jgi:hypothetical protein